MMNSSIRPRKNPSQQRAIATVSAIVEAAARILETEGLPSYTTNTIAARAGVSVGSLYQYFPNRYSITRALIQRETAALLADLQKVEDGVGDHTALHSVLALAVSHQLRRPGLARLLDFEEARLPMDREMEDSARKAAGIVLQCLQRLGVENKTLPESTHDLMAIVKGMVDAAGQRGETDVQAVLRRVERAAFGYLGMAPNIALAQQSP